MRVLEKLAITCALILAVEGVAAAVTVSTTGPNGAYATRYQFGVPTADSFLVGTGAFTALPNHVLLVNITAQQFAGAPGMVYLIDDPTAGGVALNGSLLDLRLDSQGSGTSTGAYWLDVDAAGLANQTIDVEVFGSACLTSPCPGSHNLASLTVSVVQEPK